MGRADARLRSFRWRRRLCPILNIALHLQALNEAAGNSTYHSFQLKLEDPFSEGTFLLASYTLSKLIGTNHSVQTTSTDSLTAVFSPLERHRAKSISHDDVPHVLSVAFVYDLPFGPGKRFRSGNTALNKILEGWSVSSTIHPPRVFRSFSAPASATCLPSSGLAVCLPCARGRIRLPRA